MCIWFFVCVCVGSEYIFSDSLRLFHTVCRFCPLKYQQNVCVRCSSLFPFSLVHPISCGLCLLTRSAKYASIEIEMLWANSMVGQVFTLFFWNEMLRLTVNISEIVEKCVDAVVRHTQPHRCTVRPSQRWNEVLKNDMFNESILMALERWEIIHRAASSLRAALETRRAEKIENETSWRFHFRKKGKKK